METATRYPPIPEGAPFLFNDQDKPFAGDTFMERDFLALRDRFGINLFVETGTCYGSTALWASENFPYVYTFEKHEGTYNVARSRIPEYGIIDLKLKDSVDGLRGLIPLLKPDVKILFFLDAHFDKHCPLIDELKAIADSGIKPVIAVHDMFVPGRPDLGYDTWNGKRFTFEWLKPHLERIYAGGPWGHHFNNEATGAKRGCLYCYPL